MDAPKAQVDRMIPKPFKIVEYTTESEDTFTIRLNMKTTHHPGQFVQVSIPGIGECPISICSDSREYLELSIRKVGNMTNALSKIKKGDTLFVRGPYGKPYPMEKLKGNNIVLIGGGCGVAPLRGVIHYLINHRADYGEILLFFGYRSPDNVLFQKEIQEWQKKFKFHLSVDKNDKSKTCHDAKVGFITERLKEAGITTENTAAFLCGPPVMMKLSVDILAEKGFTDEQIFISTERLMYCGIGVCCHCMIHGKFTCLDGPVFRYDEINDYKED